VGSCILCEWDTPSLFVVDVLKKYSLDHLGKTQLASTVKTLHPSS
jgi:hypothetical protein